MSLVRMITSDVGQAIVGGALATGAILDESSIAARPGDARGAGRGAVREGVKMLEAKGLLEARPRRGTAVLPPERWNLYDADVQAWMRAGTPDRALLAELLQTRLAFEPAAAASAARIGEAAKLEPIAAAHARMAAAKRGRDDPCDADLAFHAAILRASGNRFFAALVPLIDTALRHSIRITNAASGSVVGDLDAHALVRDAILGRDPDAADAAMRALLGDVERTLGEKLDAASGGAPRKRTRARRGRS